MVTVLTLNSGSSSIKFALYEIQKIEQLLISGTIKRIGLATSEFNIQRKDGSSLYKESCSLPTHDVALSHFFSWWQTHFSHQKLDAIGHRIVQGGKSHFNPQPIDLKLVESLRELIPLAPNHLPHEIKAIEAVLKAFPKLFQVACFDTAFHHHMPAVAKHYPLSSRWQSDNLIRYGFHGLSYEYVWNAFVQTDNQAIKKKTLIAHLGNGASITAIHQGKSLDTTMGFSPAGGLVMGTRSGDLDPGVLLYLMEAHHLSAEDLNRVVNEDGGLLGLSGISSDMKDLLKLEKTNPQASFAIDLFCYQAKKYIGSLSTVLGGLDVLIFTGGIGENASEIRWKICQNLHFLGINVDPEQNIKNSSIISNNTSSVEVRVIKTNEEMMIAKHTYKCLQLNLLPKP